MHSYSTDSGERFSVPLLLGIVSASIAWIAQGALELAGVEFPWWVGPPSVLTFYAALFRIFDSWLWKVKWIRMMARVQVPDLNGEWEGEARSSYSDYKEATELTMTIRQTWREIAIQLDAPMSRSHSEFAAVYCRRAAPVLTYEYLNEPRPDAIETMTAHRGVSRLEVVEGVLDGDYYSGRGRQTLGVLRLARK